MPPVVDLSVLDPAQLWWHLSAAITDRHYWPSLKLFRELRRRGPPQRAHLRLVDDDGLDRLRQVLPADDEHWCSSAVVVLDEELCRRGRARLSWRRFGF